MHLLVIALILVSGALSQNNDNAQVGNTAFDSRPNTNFAAPVQQTQDQQVQAQEQPKDIPAEQTVVEQPKQDTPQNTEIPKVPVPTQGNNGNNGNIRGQGHGNYRGGQGRREGGYRQGQGNRYGGQGQRGQGVYRGQQGQGQGGAICNPVTGIRARTGSIYSAVLQRMGVQNGNCGGNNNNGGGAVNPLTGIQARRGSIYDLTLNAVGIRGGQAGVGLLGNNPIVQAINNNGGLIAAGDDNTVLTSASAQAAMPGWAVAGIVVLSVIMVATVAVMIQLVVLLRRS
jgi:hypothetical protein